MVAFVGIAGAVAGSLAVWTALAPNATAPTAQTCQCECVTEPAPATTPAPETETESETETETENSDADRGEVAQRSGPTVRQAKAEVEGRLDRDVIRRIARAHINEVRHCYNQGLSADPELSGRVAVQFKIGSEGKVLESSVSSSTLAEEDGTEGEVATCISTVVQRWKFPKFDGEAVVVTYPFVLEPS